MRYTASAAFLAAILAANYVTTEYGMVPVGFGLMATAGTYLAGLTFVLRDLIHDAAGRWWVLALIVVGAGLSLLLGLLWTEAAYLPPGVTALSIALGSGVAFLLSEMADFAIYAPLRRRGYIRAAVASNVVGSLVDTLLFLAIAGFPIAQAFAGQMVGKLAVTLAVVVLVAIARQMRKSVLA